MGLPYMLMMELFGRGEGMSLVIKIIQQAIVDVERWAIDWGFKQSVAKSCCMGLCFNERYAWKDHVINVDTMCKKVVNLMLMNGVLTDNR